MHPRLAQPRPLTRRRAVPAAAAALLAVLLAGCSSSSTASTGAGAAPVGAVPLSPVSTGDLTQARLTAMLLQPADLPDLPRRSVFASSDLSTQAPPQLALCHAETPTAPHALANVLAKGTAIGQVQVFEVLSAYADPAGAQAAYDLALADARACSSYQAQGQAFTVQDLADVALPAGAPAGAQAAHYRLLTPNVVGGDVRTLAVSGRYVVLVTGYGAPPAGQPLLDYQADVLRRALARLS